MLKHVFVFLMLMVSTPVFARCVNEGPDKRWFKPIVCPFQNLVSFRSFREPIGIDAAGFVFIGVWPPNIAVNIPLKPRKYLHGRLGYRWDAYPDTEPEKGCWFIASAAAKVLPYKLLYWRDKCFEPAEISLGVRREPWTLTSTL